MSLIEAALRDQERRVLDAKPLEVAFDPRKRAQRRLPLPGKRSCRCGTQLNRQNTTGLCRSCGVADWKETYEAAQRPCGWSEGPCKTKIAYWSKSGLCIQHGNLLRTRIANRNRRAKARSGA